VRQTHLFAKACTMVLAGYFTLCTSASELLAGEGIRLGLFGGAAVPGGNVGNVYRKLYSDGVQSAYNEANSLGSCFGAKVRLGITEGFSLQGTASYNYFTDQKQRVVVNGIEIPQFLTSASFVPVTAGVVWWPIRSFVTIGVTGEVVYTYHSVSVSDSDEDLLRNYGINIGNFDHSRSDVGAALGLSVGIDILGIEPHVDIKNVWTNQFVKGTNDPLTSFLQISLGVVL